MAGCIAVGVALGWSGLAHSQDSQRHDVRIVTADESELTERIVDALQKKFPISQIVSGAPKSVPKNKNAIHIAVGPAALRTLLAQEHDGTVVALFTSSQAYRAILDSAPHPHSAAVTAVYAEPAPSDQLRLISMLYKKRVRVAALLSERTAYLLPVLQQACQQWNIDLVVEQVGTEDNLNRVLNRVANASALLAMPDNAIYNAENIRNILVTTYRHNQAVIGFSSAFVKAGALASTYSSIDDVIAQVEELIREFTTSGRLPAPRFPKYFEVMVNDDVARSLNIVVGADVRKLSHKPGARLP